MTAIRALFAFALLVFALPAAAQPYVFGLLIRADADTRLTPDTSGSEIAMNAGAGWRFSKHFSAEVGYLSVDNIGSFDSLTTFKIEGVGVAAVGTLPLSGQWAMVGKIGAYWLDGATTFWSYTKTTTGSYTKTTTDLGTLPLVAIGAQYHVGDAVQLQALYQQVNGRDGSELEKLRLFSIGAVLQF